MAINQLLNSIPVEQLRTFEPRLEEVHLKAHDVLLEADGRIEHVFFPLTCMVSVVTPLEDGTIIEAATIGSEGMVGLPLFLGLNRVNTRAICQLAGESFRMHAADFRRAMAESPALRAALGLYTNAFIGMLTQGSACNGSHDIKQRLSRWILTMSDRLDSERLVVTQDFLSQMLAVHRPTISNAQAELESLGLITHSRGALEIVDRPGLIKASCECYELIRRLYEETFKAVPASMEKLDSEERQS